MSLAGPDQIGDFVHTHQVTDDEGGQSASPDEPWFEGRRVKLVAAAGLALGDVVWF